MQRTGTKAGVTDSVTRAIHTVLSPIALPAKLSADAIVDFGTGIFHARQLGVENRALKDQAAIIQHYTDVVSSLNREVEEQRLLLQLKNSPGHERIAARVIGYVPFENRILLDAGSKDGVTSGLAVETGRGLVGVVESVEAHRATVLLVTSRSQIGAIDAARNPQPIGLMRGRDATTVEVTFLDPKAPVQVGDLIVTSGLGFHIPRGILIGNVVQVDTSEEQGSKKAIVDPAVSVGTLREVFVLK